MPEVLLDAAGRPRSPATVPGYHAGRSPRNKGQRYPANPPRSARSSPSCDTPAATSTGRGCGRSSSCSGAPGCASTKRSRSAKPTSTRGAARCSCAAARAAAAARSAWTTGPGSNCSPGSPRASSSRSARCCASRPARPADVRGRRALPAPSCARPPSGRACAVGSRRISSVTRHAVEMAREGVPLIVIQRQLGHTNLGITSIYLQGIDSTEIIDTVHARRPPMVPVDATLRL